MKKFSKIILAIAIAIISIPNVQADHLIVVSANDTHSQIEPSGDLGGLYRRRAAIARWRCCARHTVFLAFQG